MQINQEEIVLDFFKIEILSNDLEEDIKKLTNYSPEYRLRAGDYRVLFEIEGDRVVIYRIMHRREAYIGRHKSAALDYTD